jgi:hypothetical protein
VLGLTLGHRSSADVQYTTYHAASLRYHHRTRVSTVHYSNPSNLSMSASEVLFSAEEVETLRIDRKRYLSHSYVTTGTPLPTPSESDSRQSTSGTIVTTEAEGSATIATVSSQRCLAHGPGCRVDHGATLYGTTVARRSGKPVQLPLIEDSGSQRNWIPRALADELQCEISNATTNDIYVDFGGTRHVVKKKVAISLDGLGDTVQRVDFHVPPKGFPLCCAVLGRDFIEAAGHPHQLFPSKPDTVGIVEARITVSKKKTQAVNT